MWVNKVEKLAKAKYQDNLEFIQWLKKTLSEGKDPVMDYNAVARRGGEDIYYLNKNYKAAKKKSVIGAKTPTTIRKNSGLKGRVKNLTPVNQYKKDIDFVKMTLESDTDAQAIVDQLRDHFKIKSTNNGMDCE